MEIKHVLASSKDKKPTILHSQLSKYVRPDVSSIILHYRLGIDKSDPLYGIKFHKSRNGKTWYAESKFPSQLQMPEISKPIIHQVELLTIVNN